MEASGVGAPPVILLGRFRSGTTMFWNLFRGLPEYLCYCEPCHEHLIEAVRNPAVRLDPTHLDVDDYWREYRSLDLRDLEDLWRPWFGRKRFCLGEREEADDLAAFLRYLCTGSSARAVLKFVRFDFRASWLRSQFPDATIIHVVRNPRDLWTSSVGRGSGRDDSSPLPDERWGSFVAYGQAMAHELGVELAGHPYQWFYALWKLSFESVSSVADDTWRYEDAVADFPAWAAEHLLDSGLMEKLPPFRPHGTSIGPQFHDEAWYSEQEQEADARLAGARSASDAVNLRAGV